MGLIIKIQILLKEFFLIFFIANPVFQTRKTKNKKFFFQQNILIFADCSENCYKYFL